MMNQTIRSVVRGLGVFSAVAMLTLSPAEAGVSFPSAVEQILMSQEDGPVSRLSDDKKHELIGCVNNVLSALPNGKKRFVVEAASFDELEDRFGAVVMENRAEWKQRIAQSCAHIVV